MKKNIDRAFLYFRESWKHNKSIPVSGSICPNFPESEPLPVPCLEPDFGFRFIPGNKFPSYFHLNRSVLWTRFGCCNTDFSHFHEIKFVNLSKQNAAKLRLWATSFMFLIKQICVLSLRCLCWLKYLISILSTLKDAHNRVNVICQKTLILICLGNKIVT